MKKKEKMHRMIVKSTFPAAVTIEFVFEKVVTDFSCCSFKLKLLKKVIIMIIIMIKFNIWVNRALEIIALNYFSAQE